MRDPELQGRYEGGCVNGLAEGEGHARGTAEYRGGFRAGMKHGKGMKRWASGDEYEGDFVDDGREGRGVYRWGPNAPWANDRYEGEYRADRREGIGTYIWLTGDRYVGPWKDDRPIGPATPRQIQLLRATKAHLAAIGTPGTRVCGTAPIGIAHRQSVENEIVEVVDDRVRLRVRAVDGKPAVRDDVFFWDLAVNWRPCRK